jgi:hypothetical protein
MTKTIEFSLGYGSFGKRTIDIDGLSPFARWIADNVFTFNGCDDYSRVVLHDALTAKDRAVALGTPYSASELAVFTYLTTRHGSFVWRWPPLRRDEAPESWLERQANEILAADGTSHITSPNGATWDMEGRA